MAMCIMTPIGGRLCDIYGMRKVILVGGIISMISGSVSVFANNFTIVHPMPILFIPCDGKLCDHTLYLGRYH